MRGIKERKHMETCGHCHKRQTIHEYDYYTADYVGSYKTVEPNAIKTTNRYTNFKKHSAFVCARCARISLLRYGIFYIFTGIIYLFVAFYLIMFEVANIDTAIFCKTVLIPISILTAVAGLLMIIIFKRNVRNDKRVDKKRFSQGASEIARDDAIKNKIHPGKAVFSLCDMETKLF